jgi:group I intron endonuclease
VTSGIYIIRNLANGKVYVGSSTVIEERWVTHRRKLRQGKHHSRKFQNAWNKYGADNFEFRIIEIVQPELLVEREQYWMDACLSYSMGYNSRPKADSCLGIKRGPPSPEHRRKNAEAHTGSKSPNWGKPRSEETKRKIAAPQIGKPRKSPSQATLEKMSASQRARYAKNGLSEEHKARMDRIRKLVVYKPHSEETKRKMSESHRRRFHG